MTRINCIPVEELTREHLLAEYRELPRVFGLVAAARERGESPDDPRNPARYTLGAGHVRFFFGRLGFVERRFTQLVREMLRRGYNPSFFTPPIPLALQRDLRWWRGWEPDAAALSLNSSRIAERLAQRKETAK